MIVSPSEEQSALHEITCALQLPGSHTQVYFCLSVEIGERVGCVRRRDGENGVFTYSLSG